MFFELVNTILEIVESVVVTIGKLVLIILGLLGIALGYIALLLPGILMFWLGHETGISILEFVGIVTDIIITLKIISDCQRFLKNYKVMKSANVVQ